MENIKDYSYDQLFNLTEKIEDYYWSCHKLTVIRDGYVPETGTRIHFVKESGVCEMIDNAFVISVK